MINPGPGGPDSQDTRKGCHWRRGIARKSFGNLWENIVSERAGADYDPALQGE
jgi:hypothetical protein